MKEIRCPKCGTTFAIDEDQYAQILEQVKEEAIQKAVKEANSVSEERHSHQVEMIKKNLEDEKLAELHKLELEKKDLESKLNNLKKEEELNRAKALSEKDQEIERLKAKINAQETNEKLHIKEAEEKKNREIDSLKEKHQEEKEKLVEEASNAKGALKLKEEELEQVKQMKSSLNVKLTGETLEQHCENEFNSMRMVGFQRATFEKDNKAVEGTKGDYIFRDYDESGVEYLSIMFEMKNENDESENKKKNETHLKKLNDDRIKKNCEYAVLVTTLEKDNEYYNRGIVDLSYKYEKMYAIRPQFFIPLLTILRNTARNSVTALVALENERQQNLELTNFKAKLEAYQQDVQTNYNRLNSNFDEAIANLDKSIANLQAMRDNLLQCKNNIRIANNKTQELSVKKLTKDSPNLRKKFEEDDN